MSLPIKFRPLLAATIETEADFTNLQFPLLLSEKIDGIRAITTGSGIMSRTLKPIPNKYINLLLSELPAGIEGELVKLDIETPLRSTFEETESAVMSRDGKPRFQFWIFDWFRSKWEPYSKRYKRMKELRHRNVILIGQTKCENIPQLKYLYDCYIKDKAEGVMLRDPVGFYKFGRSTLNEQLLMKWKPWNDDEAVVIDVIEEMENNNPKELDNLGLAKRSKHIANLQGKGTMGALLVKSKKFGEFKLGSGWTQRQKEEIWSLYIKFDKKSNNRRDGVVGFKLNYRYRGVTKYNKPKHASFVKWI